EPPVGQGEPWAASLRRVPPQAPRLSPFVDCRNLSRYAVRILSNRTRAARLAAPAMLFAVVLAPPPCGSSGTGNTSEAGGNGKPHAGGSLTVLEGSGYAGAWPAGLDPATNTSGAADQSYMDAIYGQLFELGAHGKI